MHHEWLYIGVFMVVSLALPGVAIWLAGVLAPKNQIQLKHRHMSVESRPLEKRGSNSRRNITYTP